MRVKDSRRPFAEREEERPMALDILSVLGPSDTQHHIISGARIFTFSAPSFFSAQLSIASNQLMPIREPYHDMIQQPYELLGDLFHN